MAAWARRRSARNASGVSVNTRSWSQPWLAISCPAAAMRRIRAGWRSATQPKTKKVPLTPASSNKANTASALRSTRRGRFSHSALAITFSKAPTWNQSSTSTERALSMGPSSRGSGGVGVAGSLLPVLHPVDEQRQDAAHRLLLLGEAGLEGGDAALEGEVADRLGGAMGGLGRGFERRPDLIGVEVGD